VGERRPGGWDLEMMRGMAIQGRGFDFNMERDHVVTAVEIMRLPTWGLALEPIDDVTLIIT
jgi:hypothetical protein